ncbi:MAG TPA: acetylxylan esterase [Opitutaceae bacterium]|jgi:cephalosporin-C deacetylase|nr:acetylxylan esterase [Opitutaceae bacterium]
MPVFEKPLEELRRYNGINPRPADFDAYWDASLAELARTEARVELRPSSALRSAAAECFDLWFTGVGGARVYAKYLRPRSGGRHPAVLQFHGYTANSGDWSEKLAYVSQGFCLAALDCRGQGGRSEDVGGVKGNTQRGHIVRGLEDPDPRKLLYRSLFLDAAQLAGIVMALPEVDPARVGAFGMSQGGALTLACAALEPRLRRAVPIFPFLCDYQRVWEMDLAKDAYEELRLHFRRFDPRHEREAEIFTRLGYIDCQHLAPRIRAETLMLTSLMDTVCPPSTQFAAYNKISAPKSMLLYPDYGHEPLPDMTDIAFNFLQAL